MGLIGSPVCPRIHRDIIQIKTAFAVFSILDAFQNRKRGISGSRYAKIVDKDQNIIY
jgi:hypothetical protein